MVLAMQILKRKDLPKVMEECRNFIFDLFLVSFVVATMSSLRFGCG
jgi:hypothetical protein